MALGLATALRNDRAQRIQNSIDAAGAGAEMIIYSGTRPVTGGAPSGTALVTFTLPFPVAPAAVGGVLTFDAVPAENIAVSGGAAWFRIEDNANAPILDGDVGLTGSGADLELDSVTFVSGRLISIDSFVLTEGNP